MEGHVTQSKVATGLLWSFCLSWLIQLNIAMSWAQWSATVWENKPPFSWTHKRMEEIKLRLMSDINCQFINVFIPDCRHRLLILLFFNCEKQWYLCYIWGLDGIFSISLLLGKIVTVVCAHCPWKLRASDQLTLWKKYITVRVAWECKRYCSRSRTSLTIQLSICLVLLFAVLVSRILFFIDHHHRSVFLVENWTVFFQANLRLSSAAHATSAQDFNSFSLKAPLKKYIFLQLEHKIKVRCVMSSIQFLYQAWSGSSFLCPWCHIFRYTCKEQFFTAWV